MTPPWLQEVRLCSLLVAVFCTLGLIIGVVVFTVETVDPFIYPGRTIIDLSSFVKQADGKFMKIVSGEKLFLEFSRASKPSEKKLMARSEFLEECCSFDSTTISLGFRYDIPASHSNSSMLETFERIETQWNSAINQSFFCGSSCRTIVPTTMGILRNSRNQITFGKLVIEGYPGYDDILAVTAIWTTISGVVVEIDVFFNSDTFCISDVDLYSSCYDFETVCLHEFGHIVGWEDLYTSLCEHSIMEGYIAAGEKAREIDYNTFECTTQHFSLLPIMSCAFRKIWMVFDIFS